MASYPASVLRRPPSAWRTVFARAKRWMWVAAAAALALFATLLTLRGFLLLAALALPAIAICTWIAMRRPALMLVGFIFLSAFAGTLNAYLPIIPVHRLVDGVIVGMVCATLLQYVSPRRESAARIWPGAVMLAAWVAYSFFAIAYSETVSLGLAAFRTQFLFPVMFLAVGYRQWPRDTRIRILKGIVAVALLVGVYAVFRKVTGASSAELARLSSYDVVNKEAATVGGFENRQELAGWVAVTIPLCLSLAVAMHGRWRVLAGSAAMLCVFAMFASQTRIVVPGLALGVLIAGALLLGSRASAGRRTLICLAVIGAVATGVVGYMILIGGSAADSARYTRLLTPSQDPSGYAHIEKWKVTVSQLQGHPFGFGVGAAGTKSQVMGRFVNADTFDIDNSYLQIAYQEGFIVLGFFIVAILAIFYGLAKGALILRDRIDAMVAVAACAGLAAWMVAMISAVFIERWCTFMVFTIAGLAAAPLLTGRQPNETQQ